MELIGRSLLHTWAIRMGRLMQRIEFDTKIGPAAIVSVVTLISTIFVGGMVWQQLNGAQEQLSRDVDRIRTEINLMRAYDTSIALLKNDVVHIKDSVQRIERMMKLGN